MYLRQFFVDGLGHASYLLASDETREAAVIDPRRDIDIYLQDAARKGLTIRYAIETHNHNDFLSGARALVERLNAEHVASAEAGLRFPFRGVCEGDELTLGELHIRVLFTPGHTPEHVTYVVIDTTRAEEPVLAFTGGDLLVGTVGRPDLLGKELGRKLAPLLFESLHDKILKLEDYVEVLPTHGSGSLCGRGIGSKLTTTVGYERHFNEALQIEDREEFARFVLSGNPGIPTYYRRMRPANQNGVRAWHLPEPHPIAVDEFRHLAGHGVLVVDTRHYMDFGGTHIPESLNVGLEPILPTWIGWLVDADAPISLVLENEAQWSEVVTSLARVGYENVLGYLQGGIRAWIGASLPVSHVPQWGVQELRDHLVFESMQVLDVRTDAEWEEGHIAGAVHLRLDRFPDVLPGLNMYGTAAVVCKAGYRSSIAASLLRQHGFQNVVNVVGGMDAWDAAGYPKLIGDGEVEHTDEDEDVRGRMAA
jgi:hydroxyacylglutathione hydrolase